MSSSPGLFTNWEYTVLSRVTGFEGLYLYEEIDMNRSFAPSEELKAYFKRARRKEKTLLKRREKAMKKFYGE